MVERLPFVERTCDESDATLDEYRIHGFQRFRDFSRHGSGNAEATLQIFEREAVSRLPHAVKHFDGERTAHRILQQLTADMF